MIKDDIVALNDDVANESTEKLRVLNEAFNLLDKYELLYEENQMQWAVVLAELEKRIEPCVEQEKE